MENLDASCKMLSNIKIDSFPIGVFAVGKGKNGEKCKF